MGLTYLLLLVPLLQQPGPRGGPAPGEVGKFRWPPAASKTLHYKATFTKERKLPKDIQKAEKAARKAAKLYAPSRSPKQRIELSMDIQLQVDGDKIVGTYKTKLGKQSLRMQVHRPKKSPGTVKNASTAETSAVAYLGNNRISWVWGLPSAKGETGMDVPIAAIERRFGKTFTRAARKGTKPEDLRTQFGDHLIPVIWTYPLPCWIGALVSTMDLGGEAVIGGKRIIRDGTQNVKLGYRNTRVDGLWTKASASSFTLKYKLDIEQFVSQERDGRSIEKKGSKWMFHVEGLATYSFPEQAWDSIVETVTARPKDLPAAKLRALHDEVFSGTIKIQRVPAPRAKGNKGKKRRRRR